jgi:hypothetical protein
MNSELFQLRDQLILKLKNLPGFLSVGIGKHQNQPVFVISIDEKKYKGNAPKSFAGYCVKVRALGHPISHVLGR